MKIMRIKSILFAFLLLTLIMTLAVGCTTKQEGNGTTVAPTQGNETPTADPAVTDSPKPTYTADTQVFDTYDDMKENFALFQAQVPCTRSTKGYHKVGDGGAATYTFVTEKPTDTTVYERFSGVYVIRALDEGMTVCTPQMFGAYANGKNDDTQALTHCMTYAKEHHLDVELAEGDYRYARTLPLSDVKITSHNAKLSYYGMAKSVPALDMQNNVSIYGKISIWMIDNGMGNHGGRCAMGFGNYGTGVGATNCYVQHVEITGGQVDANGILFTGFSNNITIDRVTIPKEGGENIGRGVLFHWGNANDHYPLGSEWSVENGYGHVPNWKPTEHPHNIKIGLFECYNISKGNFGEGALHIAAAYDITVDELIVDGAKHAFQIWGADCGFEYAREEEKAHGQRNIKIGKLTAKNIEGQAVSVVGYALMYQDKTTKIELTIDELHAESSTKANQQGIVLHTTESVYIKKATLVGFKKAAVYVEKGNQSVKFDELNVEKCKSYAVQALQVAKHTPRSALVEIGTLNVTSGASADDALLMVQNLGVMKIGTVNVDKSLYKYVLAVKNDFEKIEIGTVNGAGFLNNQLAAVVNVTENIASGSSITFTSVSCGDVPLSTGSSCDVKIKA